MMTGSAQVAVQAVGFLSGIMVVRMLPVHEYALYTVANTILGVMAVLADSGVGIGVMSQGAKVWRDRLALGAVVDTGMALRKTFAFYSVIICAPIMLYMLNSHGASWLMCIMITISMVFTFIIGLSSGLLETPVRLHQDVSRLQAQQIKVSLLRAGLLCVFIFVFPIAAMALICAGVAQAWGNQRLKVLSLSYMTRTGQIDSKVHAEIVGIVKRKLPDGIFYVLSGQISLLLISIYGSTTAVAEVGVLSRLALLLSVVGAVVSILLVPRFARKSLSGLSLILLYFLILCLTAFVGLIIFLMALIFPEIIILIFGNNYVGLAEISTVGFNPWIGEQVGFYEIIKATPVSIMVAGACLGLVSALSYSLNASKGIVSKPVLSIPFGILVIALGISIFDFTTVPGILAISVFTAFCNFIWHSGYFLAVTWLDTRVVL
jgi:O-antigen/teichoic acid export membrane protein